MMSDPVYYTEKASINSAGLIVGASAAGLENAIAHILDEATAHGQVATKWLAKSGGTGQILVETVDVVWNGQQFKIGNAFVDIGANLAINAAIIGALGVAAPLWQIIAASAVGSVV